MEIPLSPWALFWSKDFIILEISSLKILTDEILFVEKTIEDEKTNSLGRVLLPGVE